MVLGCVFVVEEVACGVACFLAFFAYISLSSKYPISTQKLPFRIEVGSGMSHSTHDKKSKTNTSIETIDSVP